MGAAALARTGTPVSSVSLWPGLVLTGRTCTYYVKQLAQHAVMEFVDLPILANDIEVV